MDGDKILLISYMVIGVLLLITMVAVAVSSIIKKKKKKYNKIPLVGTKEMFEEKPSFNKEKQKAAIESLEYFISKLHTIDPIILHDGTLVELSNEYPYHDFGHLEPKYFKVYDYLSMSYKIKNRKYKKEILKRDTFPFAENPDNLICINYKDYTLEELKGSDWIVFEIAKVITEKRIELLKIKIEEEQFVNHIKNNPLVSKINAK